LPHRISGDTGNGNKRQCKAARQECFRAENLYRFGWPTKRDLNRSRTFLVNLRSIAER
jgi:hypothetical protein